jgi:hypothetical protein
LSQWSNPMRGPLPQSLYQSLYRQSPPKSPSVSRYNDTEATMVPGTLRGYRVWRLTPHGLGSVSFTSYVWKKSERAQCAHGSTPIGHRAPVSGCTCGLYAKHTLEAVEDEFGSSSFMYGSIKAHGRIILGDHGFRAEYAEIEALLWHGLPIRYIDPDVGLAGALNSVPFYTTRKKFLKDYPPISVDHLLPEEAPRDQVKYWGPTDPEKLWLDRMKLQADSLRAWRAQRASALLPFYERKTEQ